MAQYSCPGCPPSNFDQTDQGTFRGSRTSPSVDRRSRSEILDLYDEVHHQYIVPEEMALEYKVGIAVAERWGGLGNNNNDLDR